MLKALLRALSLKKEFKVLFTVPGSDLKRALRKPLFKQHRNFSSLSQIIALKWSKISKCK